MIHEPMTVATDYMLSVASLIFARRLATAGRRAWAAAFLFTAIGSFAGGSWHGFAPLVAAWASVVLWKITVLAVGAASAALLIAATPRLRAVAYAKFALYAAWMLFHDEFIYVIADYGLSMLIVAVVFAAAWFRERAADAPLVLGSIGVSVVAAVVQASGVTIHPHFNHNDLYHVIQLAALWMLHRGGLTGRGRLEARILEPRTSQQQ